jgi:hypothetical protein
VVCGWAGLMLAAAYGCHGARRVEATCLFVDATIVIDRGHSHLVALLAPSLAALASSSASWVVTSGDAPQLLLGAGRSWATLVLTAC